MAKFYGKVGFVWYEEKVPGAHKEISEEKEYFGDVLRKTNRNVTSMTTINDNIVQNSQISIIADPYINQHFPSIKYVEWKGYKWKVTSVDDTNPPRLILTLGEVYNGQ